MTYKMLATIPGKDVLNPTDTSDPRNLLFSSDYNSLKRADSNSYAGQTSLTTDGAGNGSVSVAHGLGYVPSFLVFAEGVIGSGEWWPELNLRDLSPTDPGGANQLTYVAKADATNLTVKTVGAATINSTYAIRYFLFVDQGA